MTLRELVNLIKFDVDQASLASAEKQISGVISKLDSFGKRASLAVTAPIAVLAGLSIRAAGEAEAIGRRFDAVFSGVSDQAREFAGTFAKDLMFDEDTVKGSMATFQGMFTGMEMGSEAALELSKRMQNVLGDFTSFAGLSSQEGQQVLVSGLAGVTRGLKQYGIVLKDSGSGLDKNASEAEKMVWRVGQIEAALKRQGAIGAATRNLNSFTDQFRVFREMSGNVLDSFGAVVLPVVSKFLALINKGIIWLRDLNASVKITIIVFAGLAALVGPLTLGLAGLLGVVKALMMFHTFLGGLAGIKTALIFALQPQFLLLAGVILVAVAALALFIEDIATWVGGGDSLTGKLLGPWLDWVTGLKSAFSLALTDFDTFVQALGIALVDGLADSFKKFQNFVNNIVGFLDNNKVGRAFKFFSGIEGVQFAAGAAGTASGFVGTIPNRLSAARSANKLALHETAKNFGGPQAGPQISVQNNIKLEVPPGTPASQVEAVKVAADRAFQYGMSKELRRLLEESAR